MGSNNSNFRDKAKIITTFNSAQEHYERFLELKGCDAKKAEDALNTSGIKLYYKNVIINNFITEICLFQIMKYNNIVHYFEECIHILKD